MFFLPLELLDLYVELHGLVTNLGNILEAVACMCWRMMG